MNQDSFWWRLSRLDPTLVRGAVMAAVALLVALGLAVAPGVPDAVAVVWMAVSAIVQALWTRGAVTPNTQVAVMMPDPIERPTVVAAGAADASAARDSQILAAARQTPPAPNSWAAGV